MTQEEAIQLLDFHCDASGHGNSGTRPGFLGMLRPFRGQLYPKNFLEIMEAIDVIKEHLWKETIDRHIISSLWLICHCGRSWAVDEGGMLRRNKLISEQQVQQVAEWIDGISEKVLVLLEFDPDKEFPA